MPFCHSFYHEMFTAKRNELSNKHLLVVCYAFPMVHSLISQSIDNSLLFWHIQDLKLPLPKFLIGLAPAPVHPHSLVFSNAMRPMLILKAHTHIMIFCFIPLYFCLQRYKK